MIFGPEHQHQWYRRTWPCKLSSIIKAYVERREVEEEDGEEEVMVVAAEGEEGVRGGWDSGD